MRPSPTPIAFTIENTLPYPDRVAGTGHMEVRNFPRAREAKNSLKAQGSYSPVSLLKPLDPKDTLFSPCKKPLKGTQGRP